jgi:hypothetical protein
MGLRDVDPRNLVWDNAAMAWVSQWVPLPLRRRQGVLEWPVNNVIQMGDV